MKKRNTILGLLLLPHVLGVTWILFSNQALVKSVLESGHFDHWLGALFAWGFLVIGIALLAALGFYALRKGSMALASVSSILVLGLYVVSVFIFCFCGLPSNWGT